MALSLKSQWKLVAAGLMAHADAVMAGEECERLMDLVEADVDGDDYADWFALVSDPAKLQALFESLAPLPAEDHRPVLEEAWHMALVDGVRHDKEVEMLTTLGERLGVESVQLEFWRDAWTQAQSARAETTVRALSTLLGDGDGGVMESVLFDLPTTVEHRAALQAIALLPHKREDVVRQLTTLPKPLRQDVLRRLGGAVGSAAASQAAASKLRALAGEAGCSPAEIDAALA